MSFRNTIDPTVGKLRKNVGKNYQESVPIINTDNSTSPVRMFRKNAGKIYTPETSQQIIEVVKPQSMRVGGKQRSSGGAITTDPYADKIVAQFPFTDSISASNFQSKGIVYGQNFNSCTTSNTNPFGTGNSLNTTTTPKYLKLVGNNDAWEWGSDDWTIEMWFKITSINRYHSLFFRHNNAASTFAFYVQILDTNKLDYVFRYNGSYVFGTSTTTLSVNTWYFLKFGKNGSKAQSYLNNVLDLDATISGSLQSFSDNNVFLGFYFSSTYSFVGNISDLRITRGIFRDTTIPTAPFPF